MSSIRLCRAAAKVVTVRPVAAAHPVASITSISAPKNTRTLSQFTTLRSAYNCMSPITITPRNASTPTQSSSTSHFNFDPSPRSLALRHRNVPLGVLLYRKFSFVPPSTALVLDARTRQPAGTNVCARQGTTDPLTNVVSPYAARPVVQARSLNYRRPQSQSISLPSLQIRNFAGHHGPIDDPYAAEYGVAIPPPPMFHRVASYILGAMLWGWLIYFFTHEWRNFFGYEYPFVAEHGDHAPASHEGDEHHADSHAADSHADHKAKHDKH